MCLLSITISVLCLDYILLLRKENDDMTNRSKISKFIEKAAACDVTQKISDP